ncbi:hypothetical protein [Streptomyces sp. NRRL B-24484]|uniref:hypothetical protein n=1 Tax=Streptomyces sp. NRRL B-24484 TaxID=1463833 RepID=UPI000A716863|nr:hypothetical protein [Streptomyces sp. NRRL B-24484]
MPDLALHALEDLVAALGAPWQVVPDPYNGHADYRRFVSGRQGRAFWLSLSSRPAPDGSPRITANGRYPDVPGYYEDRSRPRVGFSLGRPVEALVRDLRRRFLVPYEAAFSRAVQEIHDRAVAGGAREELAHALLRQFPHPDGHFQDLPREGLTVHLRLSDQSKAHAKVETRDGMAEAALTLTGLTIAQLHLVLRTLKESAGDTPPRSNV